MNASLKNTSVAAQRIVWSALDANAQAQTLERPAQTVAAETRRTVAALIDEVRSGGLDALRAITARFDGAAPESFEVGEAEFAAAEGSIDPALKQAMIDAAARITAFHKAGMAQPYAVETAPGVVCERIIRPIGRVGLYVPAGSAPLPSTALMLGVPAGLAGCREVVLCTPPRKDGTADPAVLVAARLTGVNRVFVLGGAQAIAAMAYGAGPVPACDKLFGPGNAYVTEAKQQVAQSGAAAIDMPAGPSEVLVIADAGANPDFVAADLLSQAEHGPDSQVLLLSDDAGLLDRVEIALAAQLAVLPRADIARKALSASRLVQVASLDEAFAISNTYAPEHLILALREPRAWLDKVEAAGSVFLGDYTPEALGDYCSGTNHVLPTSGAARAYSGVSVSSFQNFVSVQSANAAGILAIGPSAVTLAEAESLEAHANAVRLRIQEAAR
ncbi:histidinol dehydrogenase [Pseudoxanthomonas sp. GM95]|uniref:histidinol dehydrogenase n=1 Tax=Pseudoxanthomonas sp. GM95 TaxID=1881043 RepID=UPI0008B460F9|nr:histidinol dehydrogenase [Pseudoxanthomonas sp. GM95]SEK95806.1 histidinol dehydrogenase [Pseudoxanthomonas sp. GM95]